MENSLFRYSLFFVILSLFFSISYADEWHIKTIDSEGWISYSTSIAINNNDCPYISYYDHKNNSVKCAHWNGSEWEIQVVDYRGSLSAGISIAIDSKGIPYITYQDENQHLKYAYWTGSKWESAVIDSSGNEGISSDISIDSSDRIHIVYHDVNNESIKYAFFDGNLWHIQVIDKGFGASITNDSNNYPHISYCKREHMLNYAQWNGSKWEIVNIVTDVWACGTTIKLDSKGYPRITFIDNPFATDYCENPRTGLNYAYWDGEK
jgi:hypothetical protein